MRSPRLLFLGALILAACKAAQVAPQPDAGKPAQPPAPPDDTPPPELLEVLPKTDGGLPILYSFTGGLPSGVEVRVVYNPNRDDALSRWGQCVDRVAACYDSNAAPPIAGCIDLIPRCADARGGRACCPSACIEKFHALAATMDEGAAVDATFVEGSCIAGFTRPAGAP